MSAKNYVTGNEMIVLFFFLIRNDSTILIFIDDDIKVKSLNFILFLLANLTVLYTPTFEKKN